MGIEFATGKTLNPHYITTSSQHHVSIARQGTHSHSREIFPATLSDPIDYRVVEGLAIESGIDDGTIQ